MRATEMASWPDERAEEGERIPVVTGDFWRGLATGLPLGAILWTLILIWAW